MSARIKGSVMRRCLVVLCLLASMTQTSAQEFDVPTLRGTSPFIPAAPQYTRWAGFYFGGQVGRSSAEMNFAGATKDLVAFLLRNTALENQQRPSEWATLGKENPSGVSYGAFAGYNVQFSDVIIGFDFHYNRSGFAATAPVTPIRRVVSAGSNTYDVTVEGSASMRITDYGAARLRAGCIINNFLPYGTVGFAVGRADVTRSAHVFGIENPSSPTPTPFDFATSDAKNGAFLYGWSAGGGMDVLLMPNFFVRGEIEYIWFTKLEGIQAQIGTARVGAGWKF
ncbi:MAG: outer membrane beta-barrel protein [Xanthobacteraceae bacterium]|nr:outer membrane beta-barrel protein [Xanthobacteraceae bacterium]